MERERLWFFAAPSASAGPYSGEIGGAPALRPLLEELFRFDSEHAVSPSTLGRYGNCAFQGFLQHGLRLGEREDPGEVMDPRGEGTFFHLLLERLFPRLEQLGLLGKPFESIPPEVLDSALSEAALRAEKENHVGHPALWRIAQERARGMLRRLLQADHHGLPFECHVPWRSELGFGRANGPEGWRSIAVPSGISGAPPIYLQGKIDRVDRAGQSLGVLDYKSGSVALGEKRAQLLNSDFQLPAYLYAARAAGHRGPLHAAWLSLKDARVVRFDQVLEKAGTNLDDLLAETGERSFPAAIHQLVGRLREGDVSARPESCDFCELKAVCRVRPMVPRFEGSRGG
jgi:ATP-dependent helicase/DNAse subunit B